MSAATLAYVWPALMVATVLATFGGVAFMAWRACRADECDAPHTPNYYSAARQAANVITSPNASSAAMGHAETE